MNRPATVPAFFQVLVGDFSEKLKIPRAFNTHFHGPAHCKLEGPNGKRWDVKMEEQNNNLFFHKGWKKFVKDNFLEEGDFLVFNFDGNWCFKVTIYDESACEMDMEVAKTKRGGNLIDEMGDYTMSEGSRIIQFQSKHFCFKRTMENHRLYQMNIPIAIARAKLLDRKPTIEVLDPRNRSWTVVITPMPDGRLLMGKGWRDCNKSNQIEEGHTIVFEFAKGKVKLHIFRDESDVILAGPHVVE